MKDKTDLKALEEIELKIAPLKKEAQGLDRQIFLLRKEAPEDNDPNPENPKNPRFVSIEEEITKLEARLLPMRAELNRLNNERHAIKARFRAQAEAEKDAELSDLRVKVGKTLANALPEIREYADLIRRRFGITPEKPVLLPLDGMLLTIIKP